MELANLSTGAIDWSNVPAFVQSGETGAAETKVRNIGTSRCALSPTVVDLKLIIGAPRATLFM
jgi:hypothetical protein